MKNAIALIIGFIVALSVILFVFSIRFKESEYYVLTLFQHFGKGVIAAYLSGLCGQTWYDMLKNKEK